MKSIGHHHLSDLLHLPHVRRDELGVVVLWSAIAVFGILALFLAVAAVSGGITMPALVDGAWSTLSP